MGEIIINSFSVCAYNCFMLFFGFAIIFKLSNYKSNNSIKNLGVYGMIILGWAFVIIVFTMGLPALFMKDPSKGLLITHYTICGITAFVGIVTIAYIGLDRILEKSGVKKMWDDLRRSLE